MKRSALQIALMALLALAGCGPPIAEKPAPLACVPRADGGMVCSYACDQGWRLAASSYYPMCRSR